MTQKITLLYITVLTYLVCLNTSVFASRLAQKPEDYDRDTTTTCGACPIRTGNKMHHAWLSLTRKNDPDSKVFLAVCRDNKEELASAISAGGNINTEPIARLFSYATPKQIVLLLENGFNLKGKIGGYFPVERAVIGGNAPVLAELVKRGALDDSSTKLAIYRAKVMNCQNCLEVIEDAPQLLAQKRDEDLEEIKRIGEQEKEVRQREHDLARLVARQHQASVAPKELTDEEKKRQQEIAQQELQRQLARKEEQARITQQARIADAEFRQEQERIAAKQREKYEQARDARKKEAREKQEQFKQARKKK